MNPFLYAFGAYIALSLLILAVVRLLGNAFFVLFLLAIPVAIYVGAKKRRREKDEFDKLR